MVHQWDNWWGSHCFLSPIEAFFVDFGSGNSPGRVLTFCVSLTFCPWRLRHFLCRMYYNVSIYVFCLNSQIGFTVIYELLDRGVSYSGLLSIGGLLGGDMLFPSVWTPPSELAPCVMHARYRSLERERSLYIRCPSCRFFVLPLLFFRCLQIY